MTDDSPDIEALAAASGIKPGTFRAVFFHPDPEREDYEDDWEEIRPLGDDGSLPERLRVKARHHADFWNDWYLLSRDASTSILEAYYRFDRSESRWKFKKDTRGTSAPIDTWADEGYGVPGDV